MIRQGAGLRIENGVCYVDGRRLMLVSADYPYYRDSPAHWADRLHKIRDCHINVITCYIPWRHHQLERGASPDFTGRTQGNRDVLGFLGLCHDLGLRVIAKPGPFIHAEVNYGGLPDWVCPVHNHAVEPLLDAKGQSVCWSGSLLQSDNRTPQIWPLPAPFDPEFLAQTSAWLRIVGEQVLKPNLYPSGAVFMAQIGNEGIYSNGQHGPWAYDYSRSGLSLFRRYLMNEYQDLETYNLRHGTTYSDWDDIQPPRVWKEPRSPYELLAYIDWGCFQAEYMAEIYRIWGEALDVDLPLVVNLNPPLGEEYGIDAWLTRVEPERWANVHYGFTNWIGDVSADPSAYSRYLVVTKRATGINLEENWGFTEFYGPAYADASACFYQTLLAIAGGATGYNVYTAAATATWDKGLDILHHPPYPSSAPITSEGKLTPKFEILRWLNIFFAEHGAEFLACKPRIVVAWGLYLPYARVAVWVPSEKDNPDLPQLGRSLRHFQAHMRQLHLDYSLVNLQTTSLKELERYPFLLLHGGEFMERTVQEKLAAYVRRGGQLGLLGQVPHFDESFAPFDLLSTLDRGLGRLSIDDCGPWLMPECHTRVLEGNGDIWVRSHFQQDIHYMIVLLPPGGDGHVVFTTELGGRKQRFRIDAAPGGGALVRIERGRLTDAIVKGFNAYLKRAVVPACTLDSDSVGLEKPGDFALICGKLEKLRTH